MLLLKHIFCFRWTQNTDADKKEKEKGSASPFDSSKDDTGPQNNGLASQNGLDDDKGFKWVSVTVKCVSYRTV